jgi:WD40 repeat protein
MSPSAISSVALVVLALVPQAEPDAAMQQPHDPPRTNFAKLSLPPRALLRIGTDHLRMSANVLALAFLPDGRLLAVADANAPSSRVVIFDVQTGRPVKQHLAPGNQGGCAVSVAYSPDGTKSGSMCRKFPYPNKHGGRVGLTRDGRMLATTDLRNVGDLAEDAINLSDIKTGEQVLALEPCEGRASVTAFSPDGNKLFTGLGRSSGIVWDVRPGPAAPRPKR